MRILVLTNLYPPHHAGTYDFQCQTVTEALRERGHQVRVLTSHHGIKGEQRDAETERRLRLNGVFGHPAITGIFDLKELEFHNHSVLRETIYQFKPELVHVWNLRGLSKSLIFGLHQQQIPVVYQVHDEWLSGELRQDPWLEWWNRPRLPGAAQFQRMGLEVARMRDTWDDLAPTRDSKATKRLNHIFDPEAADIQPDSIGNFRFDRICFCSHSLKEAAMQAGFRVGHGEVIHPGIDTANYQALVKPANAPFSRFLIHDQLSEQSGVLTALEAFAQLRQRIPNVSLSIYGRGDSDYVAQLRSFVVRHELPVDFQNISDPSKDMPAVYRKHDAFLHTPEYNEPFALTPLEAMAAGLPVIASQIGGVSELLTPGQSALVYEPGNSAELTAHLNTLIAQPELRCQIAANGQALVLAHCDEAVMIATIEQYLQTTREMCLE